MWNGAGHGPVGVGWEYLNWLNSAPAAFLLLCTFPFDANLNKLAQCRSQGTSNQLTPGSGSDTTLKCLFESR